MIQHNAILSWMLLRPKPEIILFGDEIGVTEISRELGLQHVPDVARNEYGTPLLNGLFEKAQSTANNNLVCYVNSDIILMNDFMQAIERISQIKHSFLMVGRRWNLDIEEQIDFALDWQLNLRAQVMQMGHLYEKDAIDFFVFPKGLLREIPPFALGRFGYDNWILFKARSKGAALVDVTGVVTVVHQNHVDSFHLEKGETIRDSPEAKHNFELAGGWPHLFSLDDAPYLLTPKGLKFATDYWHLNRYFETLPMFHPNLRIPCWLIWKVMGLYWRVFIRSKSALNNKR